MRILLHKGTTNEKITGLLVSNAFAELRRHTITMRFIKTFHDCFNGKKPNSARSFFVPKVHKPVFYEAGQIAAYRRHPTENLATDISTSIDKINLQLSKTLFERLEKKISEIDASEYKTLDMNQFIDQLEIPSELRVLLDSSSKQAPNEKDKKKKDKDKGKRMVSPDIPKFLDGLPFPF